MNGTRDQLRGNPAATVLGVDIVLATPNYSAMRGSSANRTGYQRAGRGPTAGEDRADLFLRHRCAEGLE